MQYKKVHISIQLKQEKESERDKESWSLIKYTLQLKEDCEIFQKEKKISR